MHTYNMVQWVRCVQDNSQEINSLGPCQGLPGANAASCWTPPPNWFYLFRVVSIYIFNSLRLFQCTNSHALMFTHVLNFTHSSLTSACGQFPTLLFHRGINPQRGSDLFSNWIIMKKRKINMTLNSHKHISFLENRSNLSVKFQNPSLGSLMF